MAFKPIYNRQGWVLGRCVECGTMHYVEPHGTTALCYNRAHLDAFESSKWTEHVAIPYRERDVSGNFYIGR